MAPSIAKRLDPFGAALLPDRLPEVALRARFDLDPPDLQRNEDVDWLRTLVWSGDSAREHLEAAIRVARRTRPCLVCGDLRTDLAAVARLDATWIANESPGVLPEVAARAGPSFDDNRFLVSLDREPVALAAPHGQMLEWIWEARQPGR